MSKQICCDGVEVIGFINNSVRAKLISVIPEKKADDSISRQIEEAGTLIMSPEGFINCYQAFNQLFKELIDKGVINTQQATPSATPSVAEKPTESPNFQ